MGRLKITHPELATEAAAKAAKTVGLEIMRDARYDAPVDTGNLSRSYMMVEPQVYGGRATVQVGTNVFYAPFVEFGTSRQAAKPHLGPALERARTKWGM